MRNETNKERIGEMLVNQMCRKIAMKQITKSKNLQMQKSRKNLIDEKNNYERKLEGHLLTRS
jgi:hypothetical protein